MTRGKLCILFGILSTIILFLSNLFIGSVDIPYDQVWNILWGNEAAKESWRFIVLESRFPQALTALLCGAALSASGLMLQTIFRNPLAGPSILGIDSGASLGVALVMLMSGGSLSIGSTGLSGAFAVTISAFAGALLVMGLLLFFSTLLKNDTMLLIVGIMIGYIVSSAISLLNFFATSEGVHSYLIWGMGSFGGISMSQMLGFFLLIAVGLSMALSLIKPLNALLLGYSYAENLGINVRATRHRLLLATGLLSATTTAFCGPITFLGLAVPHVARILLGSSNHRMLMPVTLILGSSIALLCNGLCMLPGDAGIIPLSGVTPLIGAPIVIYVLLKRRR